MNQIIEIETGRVGYRDVIDHVLRHGEPRDSRDGPTLDAGWTTVLLHTPRDALPVGVGRMLSTRIAAAEAVQLIGGFSDPALMPPQFDRFREADGTFHGAYGPRVRYGLDEVARKLVADPDTRQAVTNVWTDALDHDTARRDIPCTVALGFRLRPGPGQARLDAHVVMRSQDVALGFPYDVFQFGQVHLTLARSLGVLPGRYRHTVWSLHLYDRDRELVSQVESGRPHDPAVSTPEGVGDGGPGDGFTRWTRARSRARDLPYPDRDVSGMTADEEWYRRVITR